MKTASLLGARVFQVDDYPVRDPGPGQVQLSVDYVALCGLDRRIFRGELDPRVGPNAVLGHEVSATVGAVGAGVDGLAVGQPSTVLPLISCLACPPCRAGRTQQCQRLRLLGVDFPGGLQQAWNVPAELVVPLPESLSAEHRVLVEPAAAAVRALRAAPPSPGDRVLVVDAGAVGLFVALLARAAGAEVAVAEREPHRRTVARFAGLETLDPADPEAAVELMVWTGGTGAGTVFEVSGTAEGLTAALAGVADAGTVVLVGDRDGASTVDLSRVVANEVRLVGSHRYDRGDFLDAAMALAQDDLPLSMFVTTTEPLDRVGDAFAALDEGDALRVLVDLRST